MNPTTPQPIATPPTPQPAAPGTVTGGKKMNKGLLWGIIVAAIVVIAAGAWAAYALFFATTPESLMKDAVKNLSQEKTFALDFAVGGEGASVTGNIAATTDGNDKNGEVIVTFGEGSQSVTLSLLTVDGNVFLKGTNIEQVAPLLALYSGNVEAFGSAEFITALKDVNGKWFEVTKEQLEALAEGDGGSTAATVSPQDIKKVIEIYEQHTFVKADKVFADETINGAQSAHFSVKVDKQQQGAFLEALKAANLSTFKLTDKDIETFKTATDSPTATIELWIGRSTKKFTKVKVAGETNGQPIVVTLTTATPPTFDKLERPADARPISELLTILLGASVMPSDLEDTAAAEFMY
ncbi:MAG TPA: hypothetical protein VM581_01505 [Magnetospirillaceae bacterium]|nr:hypothetical protein [Magnetospirillaceae bacterium]